VVVSRVRTEGDQRTVIEIADLREPKRDRDEQAIYDYGLALEVDLDPDRLLAEACARAGLVDFGDDAPGLADRLRIQCAAIDADAGLSGIGRLIQRRRLLRQLLARLRFEDYLRRYPEALETPLEPPVIVVGLPRSGTTHLVNLLAADSRFRSMPWWEVQEPTPFAGDGPQADGVDPRYRRAEQAWELETASAPLAAAMHDRPPWSIEEDCELMDLDVCSYTVEWHARVPSWRDAYYGFDYDAHLAFLRRALRVLSHRRGPNRWVLKTPQHLEWLGPLVRAFPDATVALTLRDPVATLQSAITMLAYGDRMRRRAVEADELASYWVDRIERLLRCAVADLELIDPARRVDVPFDAFMADELGTVTRILEVAGLGVTEDARRQLQAYLDGNPRGKNGRVIYDLRRDFGLEPADLYHRWGFYFDAFGAIRPEVD
jgi:hypothetical protein